MEDLELILAAQRGDKAALNNLLTNNLDILKGFTLKLTGDIHLASDIIQDTMLKAIVSINKFTPKAKFSTWLIKIAINQYFDYLRKNKKYVSVEELPEDSEVISLEDTVICKLEYRQILEVLQSLNEEKRLVFILKHHYGYSYEEIAAIVNCPIGTVRSRLHYSIKHMLSELEKRRLL